MNGPGALPYFLEGTVHHTEFFSFATELIKFPYKSFKSIVDIEDIERKDCSGHVLLPHSLPSVYICTECMSIIQEWLNMLDWKFAVTSTSQ